MKQRLILSFCTVALLAFVGNTVRADELDLVLTYDLNDGTWSLTAERSITGGVDGSVGFAGLTVSFDNIGTPVFAAYGTVGTGSENQTETVGTTTEVVTGFDLSIANTTAGLGGAGSPLEVATGNFTITPTYVAASADSNFLSGAGPYVGVQPDATNVTLVEIPIPPACPGPDLNSDTFVDSLDLGIMLGSWLGVVACEFGELNATAPVDSLDLGILLGSWAPPPLAAVASAVPEPTSLALLALASVSLLATRRNRA